RLWTAFVFGGVLATFNFRIDAQPTGTCPVIYNLPANVSSPIDDDVTTSANVYQVLCNDSVLGNPVDYSLATVSPFNPVFKIHFFTGLLSYDVLMAQGSQIG